MEATMPTPLVRYCGHLADLAAMCRCAFATGASAKETNDQPAQRCRYRILRLAPGGCATLSSCGNSIFLSFIFLSSAAIVACGSLSQRLKVATSDAGIPSCAG